MVIYVDHEGSTVCVGPVSSNSPVGLWKNERECGLQRRFISITPTFHVYVALCRRFP